MAEQHKPVMAQEAIAELSIDPDGVYSDISCGPGGHSALIAACLGPSGRLICRDRDPEAIQLARANLAPWADRVIFDVGRFSDLRESLARLGFPQLNGLLADLGIGMHQLRSPERGFSFALDGPIDMRMNRADPVTAADIVNFSSEEEIARILLAGGERRARRVARALVRERPVRGTQSLAQIVERVLSRTGKISAPTLTFQSLRMEVNSEIPEIESLVEAIPQVLAPGGRAVVIAFHSGEDSVLKKGFRALARDGRALIVHKHVLRPSEEEVRANPAARSARMRVLQIMGGSTAQF